MRCPERFLCTCARAADVAAHEVPGDPVFGISSAAKRRLNPDLLQRGGLNDGRGKSSLLWIAIIVLLTTPAFPSQKRKEFARTCAVHTSRSDELRCFEDKTNH